MSPSALLPETGRERLFPLDLLRVLACFLVVWQHVTEAYYIGPDLTVVRNADTPLVGWMNSLTPIEVPLFVMISGYFLLPLRTGTAAFFRRRFTRILGPFVCWCAAYAVFYVFYRGDSAADCLRHICHIPVNYGTEVGHLWFVYMLAGLYLLVPVLSPWLESCTRRQLQGYLWLWGFTTLLPYLHLVFPAVLGECFWNPTPLLHHFTGFTGYFVLGHYIRRYGGLRAPLAGALLAGGYLLTVGIYQYRLAEAESVSDLEVCWRFCGANIAVMAYAVFSLAVRLQWKGSTGAGRWVDRIAVHSYGVYLCHLMYVHLFSDALSGPLGRVYWQIPVITLCAFGATCLTVRLLACLPYSKYWLGS